MTIEVDEQLFINMLADYIATSEPFDYQKYHKKLISTKDKNKFLDEKRRKHIQYVTVYIAKMVKMNIVTEEFGNKLLAQCIEWAE